MLSSDEDMFADCDCENNNDTELLSLISQVQLEGACSMEELNEGENSIPVCREMTEETWEERFLLTWAQRLNVQVTRMSELK